MIFIHTKMIELFNLKTDRANSKGWIPATCPFCNQSDKFAIKLNTGSRNQVSFNCFHGSCSSHGTEYHLLKQLGMLHLLQHGEFIGNKEQVINVLDQQQSEQLDLSIQKQPLPLGWRRVYQDDYLDSRGMQPWQYDKYMIGRTRLDRRLRDYVVFLIFQYGENKGYIARSTKSTIEPKYLNQAVDFGKLLYGIEEITPQTNTILVVEGITDKANVDRYLYTKGKTNTVCVVSFGKKLSEHQIKLLELTAIDRVVIFYDPDAVDSINKYTYELKFVINQVKVGYSTFQDSEGRYLDPGDLSFDQIENVLSNVMSPDYFASQFVQIKKLK